MDPTKTSADPCPFCGDTKGMFPPGLQLCRESGKYRVVCGYCLTAGAWATEAQGAINWWNTRPIEDGLREKTKDAPKTKTCFLCKEEVNGWTGIGGKNYCLHCLEKMANDPRE